MPRCAMPRSMAASVCARCWSMPPAAPSGCRWSGSTGRHALWNSSMPIPWCTTTCRRWTTTTCAGANRPATRPMMKRLRSWSVMPCRASLSRCWPQTRPWSLIPPPASPLSANWPWPAAHVAWPAARPSTLPQRASACRWNSCRPCTATRPAPCSRRVSASVP